MSNFITHGMGDDDFLIIEGDVTIKNITGVRLNFSLRPIVFNFKDKSIQLNFKLSPVKLKFKIRQVND